MGGVGDPSKLEISESFWKKRRITILVRGSGNKSEHERSNPVQPKTPGTKHPEKTQKKGGICRKRALMHLQGGQKKTSKSGGLKEGQGRDCRGTKKS